MKIFSVNFRFKIILLALLSLSCVLVGGRGVFDSAEEFVEYTPFQESFDSAPNTNSENTVLLGDIELGGLEDPVPLGSGINFFILLSFLYTVWLGYKERIKRRF